MAAPDSKSDDESAVPLPQDKAALRNMIRDILQQEIESTMETEIDRRVQGVMAERLLRAFAPSSET